MYVNIFNLRIYTENLTVLFKKWSDKIMCCEFSSRNYNASQVTRFC